MRPNKALQPALAAMRRFPAIDRILLSDHNQNV